MLTAMGLTFREFSRPPLKHFNCEVPDGAVIGLLGAEGSGMSELLRAAAEKSGEITGPAERRYIGPSDALDLSPTGVLVLDHALALRDAFERARACAEIVRLQRSGSTILLGSNDHDLLRRVSDEIWWLENGAIRASGDATEVLDAVNRDVAKRLRELGSGRWDVLHPSLRRGDGRAQLTGIVTLNAAGEPATIWQSGEEVAIRVGVEFTSAVDDPVVGIMIRTRIGFEVYGTNTELERVRLGRCSAGDKRTVLFRFRCDLCPQEYSITAASHDPDGIWHDWMEDAIGFSVIDSRYTAGVANLRARVTLE